MDEQKGGDRKLDVFLASRDLLKTESDDEGSDVEEYNINIGNPISLNKEFKKASLFDFSEIDKESKKETKKETKEDKIVSDESGKIIKEKEEKIVSNDSEEKKKDDIEIVKIKNQEVEEIDTSNPTIEQKEENDEENDEINDDIEENNDENIMKI